jgi:hypothetical protein
MKIKITLILSILLTIILLVVPASGCKKGGISELTTPTLFPELDNTKDDEIIIGGHEQEPVQKIDIKDINITIVPENPYIGKEFEIHIDIDNPEIKIADLTYDVYIGDKFIGNYNSSPIKVTAPDKEEDLELVFYPPMYFGDEIKLKPHIAWLYSETLDPIPNESGSIVDGVGVYNDGYIAIGDSDCNNIVIGFVSFNIGQLIDTTIENATLILKPKSEFGDFRYYGSFKEMPFDFIWLSPDDPENYTITPGDLDSSLSSRPIPHYSLTNDSNINNSGVTISGKELKNALQRSLNKQLDRIIFTVGVESLNSNNNNVMDGYLFDVELEVEYTMSEKTFSEPAKELSEEIGGIGVLLTQDEYGRIVILEPLRDSSTENAELLPGDWIIAVDGVSTENMDIDTVANKIMGPVDSKVAISVYRNDLIQLIVRTRRPL